MDKKKLILHFIPGILVLIFMLFVISGLKKTPLESGNTYHEIDSSFAIEEISKGEVKTVQVPGNELVYVNTADGKKLPLEIEEFLARFQEIKNNNITVIVEHTKAQNPWIPVILLAAAILPVGIFIYKKYAKTKEKYPPQAKENYPPSGAEEQEYHECKEADQLKIKFSDLAGIEEAIDEMNDFVEYLKNPLKYQQLGAQIPRGVMFYGPPGTGKTLLAKAVAGEAGVPFFAVSGSEFSEKYIGVGAARIRRLFQDAKQKAPCIIFIDEIDCLGRKRGGMHNSEDDKTLNQLLCEMDGFYSTETIVVIGSTNRLDVLDEALLRPGRFSRHVQINPPDYKGRLRILEIHTKNKPLNPNVNLEIIARKTPMFSGADLYNVCNEAAILAAKNDKTTIEQANFISAIDRVIAGLAKKNNNLSDKEKNIVAYHEAGHALAVKYFNYEKVEKVSIRPTGSALGYVFQIPKQEKMLHSKEELLAKIKTILAGRAAEEIMFKDVTTGAQNDLQKAMEIASSLVSKFGMTDLGLVSLGEKNTSVREMEKINVLAEKIIKECYGEIKRILNENKNKLIVLAEKLKEVEILEFDEFEKLMGQNCCA